MIRKDGVKFIVTSLRNKYMKNTKPAVSKYGKPVLLVNGIYNKSIELTGEYSSGLLASQPASSY
ncbi:MAG: hypothetical protein HON76_02205 [Candidatus Scalindua sp.]|nr:hypothetical protein [Candidatus Scalindua sp.]